MVGGPLVDGQQDYSKYPFNLATEGQRQPGSAFKPFTLAVALQHGYTPYSVIDSKPATITALIGWQLVLSPIVVGINSLGSVREVLLDAPLLHIDPFGGHDVKVGMSLAAIVATLALWPLIATALGAWRARTMDA